MANKQYNIIVSSPEAQDVRTLKVAQHSGDKGQALRIKAKAGEKYQLVELEPGKAHAYAPQYVKVKRVGKDLVITFEDGSQPDVIIEGYYDVMAKDHQGLIGEAEDGKLYEYIPEDPHPLGMVPLLPEGGEAVNVALGAGEVLAPAGAAVAAIPLLGPLLGLGAAAAAAAAGTGGNTTPANTSTGGDLSSNSDSGSSNTDNLTKQKTDLVITGKGEPNSTVDVVVKDATGKIIYEGKATTDANGNYSYKVPGPLDDGTYTPFMNGTQGTPFTIDTQTSVDITNGGAAGTKDPISGTAEPGATVVLKDKDGNTIGTTTAGADGKWSITPSSALPAGVITATATDAAGNTANDTANNTNTSSLTALSIDPITGDNILTAKEQGETSITVTGQVTGKFAAGDVVTLVVGGQTITVTVGADGNYVASVPVSAFKADTDLKIEGSVKGTGGDTATAAQTYTLENTDTPVKTALAIDPITEDNIIGVSETGGDIAVTGKVTGKYAAGDEVTLTVNGKTFKGAAAADGSFSIKVPATDLLADSDTTVDGSVTGKGGTTATAVQNYGIDPHVPPVDPNNPVTPPTLKTAISLDPVTGDNLLGSADLAKANTTLTGKVTGTFAAGDTVTLTLNGKDVTAKVDAQGAFSVSVPTADLQNDPDTKIEASVTGTGGSYANAAQEYVVDSGTTPTKTALTIDPVTTDNIINASEAGQTTIPVTGKVSGAYKAGDTVTLTINGKEVTTTVAADGSFSKDVPTADLLADKDSTIEGTVTGTGGTPATAAQNYGVDTTPSYPDPNTLPNTGTKTAISLDAITGDNVLAANESGNINVTGKVSGTFAVGDTVTLIVNGKAVTGKVLDAAGNFSIAVPAADLLADKDSKIEAQVTGTNGDTATAAQDYIVEANPAAPTQTALSIDPITGDNFVGATEKTGYINVTGKVSGKFAVGDTVTLEVNGNTYTGKVLDAAGTFSIAVPAADIAADNDSTITGSVTGTNGTKADALQNYAVDTADTPVNPYTPGFDDPYNPPNTGDTLAISLKPVTGDNIVTTAEGASTITLSGKVSGAFAAGDTVKLYVNGSQYTGQVDAQGNYSIVVKGSDVLADQDSKIEAEVTNAAGQTATAAQDYVLDTRTDPSNPSTLGKTAIAIDPITGDNYINASEGGQALTTVTGKVSGSFAAGDKVTLTINDKLYTGTAQADGTFSIAVPTADLLADPDTTVDASVNGTGGTTASAIQNYALATDINPMPAPGPNADPNNLPDTGATTAISLKPITGDNVITPNEATGTVKVEGVVSGTFAVNDVVTIYVNGNTYTGKVLDAAGNFSIDVPAAQLVADQDTRIEASVTGTGGDTATALQNYVVETTPSTPTQTALSIDPITGDNYITAAEKSGLIEVTGKVSGKFAEGDKVTLSLNGHTYTALAAADGSFSVEVNALDLLKDTDTTITASVTGTGGTAADAKQNYAIEPGTTPAPEPVPSDKTALSIDPITGDNLLTLQEQGADTVTVTGTVSGTFKEGDIVTLVINGNNYVAKAGAKDANGVSTFSVDVGMADLKQDADTKIEGSITGTGGSPASAEQNYAVETDANAGKQTTLSIDPITGDNLITAAENTGLIAVTGTIGGAYKAGDTVTLTVNGKTYTGVAKADATFSVEVPAADLVADQDTTVEGTINGSGGTTATAVQNYAVDNSATPVDPTGKTTALHIDPISANEDNILSLSEQTNATTTVTGFVSGAYAEGDKVNLLINGTGYTAVVKADGSWSIGVSTTDLVKDADTKVEGTVTGTGGSTATAAQDYVVETSSNTGKITSLSIDPITEDNIIGSLESTGTIAVTGQVTGAFSVNDTVTLTINGKTFTGKPNAQGVFSIDVPAADLLTDQDTTVDGTVSGTGGTTATAIQDYGVDPNINPELSGPTIEVSRTNTGDVGTAETIVFTLSEASSDFTLADITITDKNGTSIADKLSNFTKVSDTVYTAVFTSKDVTAGKVTIGVKAGTFSSAGQTNQDTFENPAPAGSLYQADNAVELNVPFFRDGNKTPTVQVLRAGSGDLAAGDTETLTFILSEPSTDFVLGDIDVSAGSLSGFTAVTGSNGTVYTATYTPATNAKGVVTIGVQDGKFSNANAVFNEDTYLSNVANATQEADNAVSFGFDTVITDPVNPDPYNPPNTGSKTAITIDPITGDNVLAANESGNINVTGKVSGAYAVGDDVTLYVAGKTYTGKVLAGGSYSIAVPAAELLADKDSKIEADVTGTGGDKATAAQDYIVETNPSAPTQTAISVDPVTADNVLSGAEKTGSINVTGKVTGKFAEGDKVTLSINGKTFTGLAAADGSYTIAVPAADLVADGDTTIDASVNGTGGTAASAIQNYVVDSAAAPTPSPSLKTALVIDPITGDNIITVNEGGVSQTAVTGTVSGTFATGDIVTVVVNGKAYTGTAGADGKFTISVPTADLKADADSKIEGAVMGGNGGGLATAAQDYVVETAANAGKQTALSIDAVTADDVISATEAALPNTTITGKVTGAYAVGDTVTLTVNGKTYTGNVVAGGTYSIAVPTTELLLDPDTTIDGTITGTGGTTAAAMQNYAVDNNVAPPVVPNGGQALGLTIDIDNNVTGGDGLISAAEKNGATTTSLTASFDPTKVAVGQIVAFTDGTTIKTVTLTAADVLAGKVTSDGWALPAEGATLSVKATLTDGTSTTPEATDSAKLDTTVPNSSNPLGLSIDLDKDNNTFITAGEKGTETTTSVTATFDKNKVAVGDVVTISDGTTTRTIALTADDVAAGQIVTTGWPLPADTKTLTMTATLKDAAGNTTPQATDSATLDSTTPNNANEVKLEIVLDANDDGFISAAEKQSATVTSLKASFDSAKVAAGDIVTFMADGITKTITLTDTDVTNGFVISAGWALPTEGGTLSATAVLKDAAGNSTPLATDSAKLDTTLPNNGQAVGLTIDLDANNDGTINGTELGTATTTSLTATFDKTQVSVGDKVTFTAGGVTKVVTLTAEDIAAGKVTSTGWALPAEDATLTATAVLTDAAGNATPQATDTAKLDAASVSLKTALTIEPITGDNIVTLAEQGVATVEVKGQVSGAFAAGNIVTLTLNGKDYTAAVAADGSYSVNVNTTDLIADSDTRIEGKVTGTGGDTATALQDYQVETAANAGKLTALSIDPVTADNILSVAESAAGSVNITGKVTGAYAEGDVVTLTLNGKTFSGAVNASGVYSIAVAASDLAADGDTTIDATVTGTGGTAATALQNYGLDTTPPLPPNNNQALGLSIDLDKTPDDGFINATEKGSATDTSLTATFTPANVAVGQVVTFTVGTTVKTVTLTSTDVSNGFVTSTGWALPTDGSTLTATAVLTDALGRSTPVATDTTKLDLTTPNNNQALGLTIDLDNNVTGGDGYISAAEKGSATTTNLTATFDKTKVAVGDVITFKVGTTEKTVTLDATMIAAGQATSTDWALPAEGGTLTATATLKDAAGNTTPEATDTTVLDTTAPNNNQALGLTIDADVNNDGFINAAEKTGATTTLTATFDGSKAAVGDKVTFTVAGVTDTVTLTQAMIDVGTATSDRAGAGWTIPADGSTMTATAVLTDVAGNSTPVKTDTAIVDTTNFDDFTNLDIVIKTDADDNKLIGQPELDATGGKINVEVTLPVNAKAGDVLLITGTGNSPQSITLTGAQISAGTVLVNFNAPANGTNFVATAKVTDAAGNTSATVSDDAVINTQAAGAPTVTITEDTNNDGYINTAELVGTIEVNVKAPTGAVAGDQLIVTKPDGTTQTFTLTSADLTSGVNLSYTAPGADGALTFSAVHVNQAGTPSAAGTDTATLDRSNLNTGLAIVITTDLPNNDGFISQSELTASGNKVAVKVTLAPGAAVGDTLTITGSGNTDQTVSLTQTDISNGYVTATFNPTADNSTFVATASLKDAAGNTGGPVQDQATMRVTSAGAPTVTITEDINNDGLISTSELQGNIDVEYGLPATAAAGDTLVITKPDGTTEEVLLQAADITAGKVSRSYTAPADGSTVTTSAQLRDAAGNLGATGSDSAVLDLTAPNNNQALGLTIDIDNNVTGGDGFISNAEKNGATTTSLTATFDKTKVAVNDVVTFTVGTTVKTVALTQAMIDAGKVTSNDWALPAEGGTLTATATLKDAAGNTTPVATDTAVLDTTAPNGGNAVGLTIDADSDSAQGNGIITEAEKGSGSTTSLTATFDKTKVSVGDTITFSDGTTTKDVVLTQAMIDAGKATSDSWNLPANGQTLNVTAVLKDQAGNATMPATDSAVMQFASNATATIDILGMTTDSGTSATDFVTKDQTLVYNGKVNGWVAGLGDRVMVQLFSSTNPFTPAVTGFVTPNADGTWSWSGDEATTRPAGLYNLVATIVSATGTTAINVTSPTQDANGNYTGGGYDTQLITIDTAAANTDVNLSVKISTDSDNSGVVNKTELAGASTFTAEASFDTTKAKAGDVITFTATNGSTALASQSVTLTQAMVDAGKTTVNFAVPTGTDVQTVKVNYTDLAGNVATDTTSAQLQDSASLDVTTPTIVVSSDKTTLKKGETATLTFTLSEASTDFIEGDVAITGGALSNWVKVSPTVYTATFTPTDNVNLGSATISVASDAFADAAGNKNADGADADNKVDITWDTAAPTTTVTYSSMTKDTSATTANADWTTADLSAGRLLSGHLSAALQTGETLKIYVDKGDGTGPQPLSVAPVINGTSWEVTDLNGYNASWTYTAKVVDAAGNAGATQTQVVNLVTAPTITSALVETYAATTTTDNLDTGYTATTGTNFTLTAAGGAVVGGTSTAYDAFFGDPLNANGQVLAIHDVNSKGTAFTGEIFVTHNSTPMSRLQFNYTDLQVTGKTIKLYAADGTVVGTYGPLAWDAAGTTQTFDSGLLTTPFTKFGISGGTKDFWYIDNISWTTVTTAGNPVAVASGSTVYDTTPTLQGTTGRTLQAGETLHIFDGTTDLGAATVTGTNWTYTATLPAGTTKTYTAAILSSSGQVLETSYGFTATQSYSASLTPTASAQPTTGADSLNYTSGTLSTLAGNDTITATSTSVQTALAAGGHIDGGAGVDTLKLAAGTTLDLTQITNNQTVKPIQEVEVIEMTGTSSKLTMSTNDVLSLGGTELSGYNFSATTQTADGSVAATGSTSSANKVQMVVKGLAGDTLNLGALANDGVIQNGLLGNTGLAGTWAYKGQVTIGATTYKVYDHSTTNAQVLVDVPVNVNTLRSTTITAISDDTGASATDFFTSDNTLSYTGGLPAALAAGESVKVQILAADGTTVLRTGTATVNGTNWTWTDPGAALADGKYTIKATIVDGSGNQVVAYGANGVATQPMEIDHTAPTQTVLFSSMTKDSGRDALVGTTENADWTTADTSAGRLVSGSISAPLGTGEQLAVYSNGTFLGYATVAEGGKTWAITDTNGYSSSWTYTAKVVDAVGNEGATQTQLVNADNTAPAAVAITTVYNTSNTSVATTSGTTLTVNSIGKISGTVSAADGDTVSLYDASTDTLIGTTTVSGGTWEVTNTSGSLAWGTNTLYAVVSDPAGNSLNSAKFDVTVPRKNYSGLTDALNSSTLAGWPVTEATVDAQLIDPDLLTAVGPAGDYQFETFITLAGTTTKSFDVNMRYGNDGDAFRTKVSGLTAGKTYVAYYEYGASTANVVTGYTRQSTFSAKDGTTAGANDVLLNGATSQTLTSNTGIGTNPITATGFVKYTFVAPTNGTVYFTWAETNTSTNGSGSHDIGNFQVYDSGQDTAVSAGTVPASGTPGPDTLSYTSGALDTLGGGDTINVAGTDLQAKLAAGGSITGGSGIDILKLAAGTTLDLTAITNNQTVQPIREVEVFTLQGTSKLVMSANDVLSLGGSNASTMSTYTFASTTQGTGATGSTASTGKVQFVVNGTNTDTLSLSALATDGVTTAHGVVGNTALTGQWDYKGTVTLTGVDGVSHTYKVYDHSTTQAQVLVDLPITVDTLKPLAITAISTDSNIATDFITNDTSIVYSGSVPVEFNPSTQRVYVQVYDSSNNALFGTFATVNGTNWTLDRSQAGNELANGDYTIKATIVGISDTTPVTSYGSGGSTTHAMTIDTVAPNGGAAPTVTIVEDNNPDNGFLTGAEIGNATTVSVKAGWTGTVKAGDQVVLSDGTTTQTVTVSDSDVTNQYVTTTFAKPADGSTITVTAQIKDLAGNSSSTASDSAYVDATSPTQTVQFTSMTKDSSTTTANADWTTGDASAGRLVSGTVSTTLAADERVAVYSNGTLVGYATLNDARTAWAITDINGYSANWTYTAKVVDAAGNTGTTQTQVVNADLTAAGPVITGVKDSTATSITNGGTTTKTVTTVVGTAEANATVYVYDSTGTNLVATTTADGNGAWTATIASPTGGAHTFAAVQLDAAGNQSVFSNLWSVTGSAGANTIVNGDFATDALTGFTVGSNITWVPTTDFQGSSSNVSILSDPSWAGATVPASTSTSGATSNTNITWAKQSSASIGNPDGALTGQVLAANIAGNSTKTIIWQDSSVDVVAGNTYAFKFDYQSNFNGGGSFNVDIDGVTINVHTNAAESGHFTVYYKATATKSIDLSLWGKNSYTATASSYGDVFLDNLSFAAQAPASDNTLVDGAQLNGATSGAETLSYTSGTIDTLGGGDTITVSGTDLQAKLAAGGRIVGGSGIDTLKLAAGTTLDLEALTNNQTVKSIEEVEVFTLQGSSTLTMSANDVLSLGGAHASTMSLYAFSSTTQTADGYGTPTGSTTSTGKVQFVVNGTSTDKLNLNALANDGVTGQNGVIGNTGLSGEWLYRGTTTITGVDGASHTYKVYDHSTTNAQVLVDLPITVNTLTPVTITSISTDSGLSAADFVTNDPTLVYTGKLPSGFNASTETVKVDILNSSNAVVYSGNATVNGANWTWDDTAQTLSGGSYTIKATVVNTTTGAVVSSYGANGTTTQALTVDTTAPNGGTAPTVLILADANDNGIITVSEDINATLDVKVSWTGTVVAGDTVLISDGATVKAVTLTDTDVSNKFVTVTYNKPADGQTLTVTAHIADSAGNTTATATDSALIDESVVIPFDGNFGNSNAIGTVESGLTIVAWSPDQMLPTETNLPTNTQASPNGGSFYTAVDQGTAATTPWNYTAEVSSFNLTGLVAGQTYTMGFYQAVVGNVTATGSSTLKWYDAGHWLFAEKVGTTWTQLAASPTMSGIGSTNAGVTGTNWTYEQISFVATGTSMTIAMAPVWDGAVGGGTRLALDGVSVKHVPPTVAPVVLDLDHDGVFSTQQVVMDVNSDGHMDLSTWAGKADGVLVLDQGGDRQVTNASEYAFTQYGGKTDLEGLRIGFDTNADGVLDSNDARFGEFAVWQDANGNGVSDAGEVKTLAELGITSINLTSNGQTDASQAGMLVHGTTTAQTANGDVQVADAEFGFQTLNLVGLNDVQLSLDNLGATLADLSGNAKPDLLHLNVSDVLQLQTTAAGVHQLEVLGDANDVVDLSSLFADGHAEGQWAANGQVTQNGHTFNVYQYSGDQSLQVLIDQHIVQSNVHLS